MKIYSILLDAFTLNDEFMNFIKKKGLKIIPQTEVSIF